MARATLCLLDVQALYGGLNVFLRADGECVVQRVAAGEERRYEFGVATDEAIALLQIVKDDAFCQSSSLERNGVGDEASIVIQLVEEDKQLKRVWKWANDQDARFDAVYERMRAIAESQPEDSWVMSGSHEWDYRPDWMRV